MIKFGLTTALVLGLGAISTAQQAAPISITQNGNQFTLTNVSKKAAVLVTASLAFGSTVKVLKHDYLFKPDLFPAGDTIEFGDSDSSSPAPVVTIAFVQFVDGSTYGDPNSQAAQEARAWRKAALAYLPTLANTGTVSEFTAALNQKQTSADAGFYQRKLQRDSTLSPSVAWQNAKNLWATAQSRTNLWNF